MYRESRGCTPKAPAHPRLMAVLRAEEGTASMETLLCLPFIFLLLVLVVDLGYGSVIRIKAQGAVRFAGMSYVRAPDGSDRPQYAKDQIEQHYGGLNIQRPTFGKGPKSSLGATRRINHLTVPVRPPFGTILTAGEVEASFVVMNLKVWNYDRVPLAVGPLLHKAQDPRLGKHVGSGFAAVIRVLASVMEFFAWWLGMTS